jgi:hypothetical protein
VSAYEAGKFTRRAMRTNATNSERDGAAQAGRIRDAARLQIGRQITGMAGSGFALDGSAKDAILESFIEAQLDQETVRRQATSQAQGYRLQGEMAYAQGHNAMVGGFISGAAKMFETAANYAGAGG